MSGNIRCNKCVCNSQAHFLLEGWATSWVDTSFNLTVVTRHEDLLSETN